MLDPLITNDSANILMDGAFLEGMHVQAPQEESHSQLPVTNFHFPHGLKGGPIKTPGYNLNKMSGATREQQPGIQSTADLHMRKHRRLMSQGSQLSLKSSVRSNIHMSVSSIKVDNPQMAVQPNDSLYGVSFFRSKVYLFISILQRAQSSIHLMVNLQIPSVSIHPCYTGTSCSKRSS